MLEALVEPLRGLAVDIELDAVAGQHEQLALHAWVCGERAIDLDFRNADAPAEILAAIRQAQGGNLGGPAAIILPAGTPIVTGLQQAHHRVQTSFVPSGRW